MIKYNWKFENIEQKDGLITAIHWRLYGERDHLNYCLVGIETVEALPHKFDELTGRDFEALVKKSMGKDKVNLLKWHIEQHFNRLMPPEPKLEIPVSVLAEETKVEEPVKKTRKKRMKKNESTSTTGTN